MSNKKKILQINTILGGGSTGRIADNIGNLIIEQGWESYIAYGRRTVPSQSKTIVMGSKWSIAKHVLLTRLFDKHGLGSKRATQKLIDEIQNIKPDIIHLHNIHGYYLNIKVLFEYLSQVHTPVVWTLHDCWVITGHCAYFDYVQCEKWKTQCFQCPQKDDYPESKLFDRSQKNYTLKKSLFNSVENLTIVPVSQWLNDLLKDSFVHKFPTKLIYNGIDLSIFKPSVNKENAFYKLKENKNSFIILGVANIWSRRKGLADLKKLRQKLSPDFIIILVGLTKKQIQDLPPNIIALERTNNIEELAELYSLSDVFVNPTWEDNFPTSNLEALACGTPVITYKTGGSVESVDDTTGFIVEKGSIDGLVECIEQVKALGKAHFSEHCVQKANRLYDKNQRFQEYITLYKDLLHV